MATKPAGKASTARFERVLASVFDALDGPLAEAQSQSFDIYEVPAGPRRVAALAKLLALSPFCADAWGMLATEAPRGSEVELDLLMNGVLFGAAALGASVFEQEAGHFWGILETRPYMRARAGLSVALWRRGRLEEAAGHLREMLRLCPGDNLGMRYLHATVLLKLDARAELADLLHSYRDEDSAFLYWTAALFEFRQTGASPASTNRLAMAREANPHVVPMLLDWAAAAEPRRFTRAGGYEPGSPQEASIYLEDNAALWAETPGALDWLRALPSARASVAVLPPKPAKPPKRKAH